MNLDIENISKVDFNKRYSLVKSITFRISRLIDNKTKKIYIKKPMTRFDKNEPYITSIVSCKHKNIICLYKIYNIDGNIVLLFDDVEGVSLSQYLDTIVDVANKESIVKQVLIILLDVCYAIKYIHDINIIDLDIKPDNIVVSKNGVAYLIDFGTSCELDCKDEDKDKKVYCCNKDNLIKGTNNYMAPEIINREYEKIGKCSDIWSLAKTFLYIIDKFEKHNINIFNDNIDFIKIHMLKIDVDERVNINDVIKFLSSLLESLS